MGTNRHWGRDLPNAHKTIKTRCEHAEMLDAKIEYQYRQIRNANEAIQKANAELYALQCERWLVEQAIMKDAETSYAFEVIAEALSPTKFDLGEPF